MIYPIPPGLFCVPSAIVALTGADVMSVVVPAINRHGRCKRGLLETPAGVRVSVMTAVLEELGCRVRPYRSDAEAGQLRAHVATWAIRSSERWPDRNVLVTTTDHALVVHNGVVYDSWMPHGVPGVDHPFAKTTVTWAALVQKKSPWAV